MQGQGHIWDGGMRAGGGGWGAHTHSAPTSFKAFFHIFFLINDISDFTFSQWISHADHHHVDNTILQFG